MAAPPVTRERRRVLVRGVVQGVGFRPFVYALARGLGLSGSVVNSAVGVEVEIEGSPEAVAEFVRRVRSEPPPLAVLDELTTTALPTEGGTEFVIEQSTPGGQAAHWTLVSPDVATCDDCVADLTDPRNRRYRHAFVTCTNCGPRFTIVVGLPYDRGTTTMARFPMCAACALEYADPGDRRFHAQPIACRDCGPRLRLDSQTVVEDDEDEAVRQARILLSDGGVVAVKGLGGYHLACDATDSAAVELLRKRKNRGNKPFAVMVPSVTVARAVARLDPNEETLLDSFRRPIVLVARSDPTRRGPAIVDAVAPRNAELGLMLPSTPLHHLLFGLPGDAPGPQALVMTSGNLSGEPIAFEDADARDRLADLADAWLWHDRPIHVPCDDSVVRVVDGTELPVRRSRGYAPYPLAIPFDAPPTLATGGDLKNTFCLASGRYAWMSAHVGDMDDLATLTAFERAEQQLEQITGVVPASIATDRHPAYRSRTWARRHAGHRPVLEVQHHHAHVASTLAEHGWAGLDPVIGVAFDGTGYGDDGAIWGGEVLVASYAGYRRAAHLGYVPVPGGDAGVRHANRMALSHLRAAGLPWDARLPSVSATHGDEQVLLEQQLATGFACAPTSSMGRLFDAVSSLTGVCQEVEYEAQAAMELEGVTRGQSLDGHAYRFTLPDGVGDGPLEIGAAPVVADVAADVMAGLDPDEIGGRFHRGVTALVVDVADRVRAATGISTVTLSGGVFLNALLTSWCTRRLTECGFTVLRHTRVPPSDAGLALGQLAVLAHQRPSDKETSCV